MLLKEVLRQLQLPNLDPKLDPTKILRKDIVTHINDLDKVLKGVKRLANKLDTKLFLVSADALQKNVFDARAHLWASLIPIDIIHAPTSKIAEKIESALQLNDTLEKCRHFLQVAIKQFRI